MEIMLIIIFIVFFALVLTGIHIKDTEENKDAIEEINEVTKGFDSSCSYSPSHSSHHDYVTDPVYSFLPFNIFHDENNRNN